MIKRKLCLLLGFSLLLTGCSSMTMTTSESGQVAEYIAYSLLKYQKAETVVIDDTDKVKDAEENPQTTEDNKENQMNVSASPSVAPSTDKPEVTPTESVQAVGAGELFGSKDFQISIRSKGLYKSYPKNSASDYLALSAKDGKKILVLELIAKNTGTSDQVFRTSGTELGYALAGKESKKALVTILEHDIHFVKSTVKPGKSLKTLMFFEVKSNYKDKDMKVTLSKADKTIDIPVKSK